MSDLAVTLTVDELRQLVRTAAMEAVAHAQLHPTREVMTLQECAEFIGRHPKVVAKLIREKGLPARYISDREPRFLRSEVIGWLGNLPAKPKEAA